MKIVKSGCKLYDAIFSDYKAMISPLKKLPIEYLDFGGEEDYCSNNETTLVFGIDFKVMNDKDVINWSNFLFHSHCDEFELKKMPKNYKLNDGTGWSLTHYCRMWWD